MQAWLETVLGLVVLIAGAELLLRGAVWIALALGVRPMTVGLTLVAFGTSAPELVVGLESAATERSGIALGTVLGSNLANILLIVGLSATVKSIRVRPDRLECNYLLFATALTAVPFLMGERVERWLGILLLAVVAMFTIQLLHRERSSRRGAVIRERPPMSVSGLLLHLLMVLLGVGGLKLGGDWLVSGASAVAIDLGMSEAMVGMTIVAIGTSLPELATSVLAARRGHPEICIGNVIGSNVFNSGMVLGATATVFPMPAPWDESGPLMVAGLCAAVFFVVLIRATGGVPRGVGLLLLLGYAGFLASEVFRG